MTGQELIEALQKLTPEQLAKVIFYHHCRDCAGNEVVIIKDEEWGIVLK